MNITKVFTETSTDLIVWQRFCELARLRIAYCLSVCASVSCPPPHVYRQVLYYLSDEGCELCHAYVNVKYYYLFVQPFARQAVR